MKKATMLAMLAMLVLGILIFVMRTTAGVDVSKAADQVRAVWGATSDGYAPNASPKTCRSVYNWHLGAFNFTKDNLTWWKTNYGDEAPLQPGWRPNMSDDERVVQAYRNMLAEQSKNNYPCDVTLPAI
jgi:hypothetical protein